MKFDLVLDHEASRHWPPNPIRNMLKFCCISLSIRGTAVYVILSLPVVRPSGHRPSGISSTYALKIFKRKETSQFQSSCFPSYLTPRPTLPCQHVRTLQHALLTRKGYPISRRQ